jgi:hypothetical protein
MLRGDFRQTNDYGRASAGDAASDATYVIKLTSEARGRDLLHQALLIVCDPDIENRGKPWDPGKGSFLARMRIVIHHIAQRGWRSALARREVLDDELAAEASASDPDDVLVSPDGMAIAGAF